MEDGRAATGACQLERRRRGGNGTREGQQAANNGIVIPYCTILSGLLLTAVARKTGVAFWGVALIRLLVRWCWCFWAFLRYGLAKRAEVAFPRLMHEMRL